MTLYEKFDRLMMKGANKLVRVWNWTTGRTKSDLATLLNTGGWVLFNGGLVLKSTWAYIIAPLTLLISYADMRNFYKIEEKEDTAKESCAKSYEAKESGNVYRSCSPLFFGFGTADLSLAYSIPNSETQPNRQLGNLLEGTGLYLMSAAGYVINADNLPPRKNCLSRSLDYLIETLRQEVKEPTLVPIPNKIV